MSYVVLARKYRPRSFEQMVGQEHVVRALAHALQQQRLHHAYLFTGTRGIGKTTVSRILAKCLNCTGPDGRGGITATPCGECSACVEIDEDRYIDYVELDAASNRGIDEARELIDRAAYKPGTGRFKVFMIDEAHQLTRDAFSALLKTLEEPPEYLKFVLATTDPEKMLPTVLSRCLQFNLRPMAPDVIAGHLDRILQAEGVRSEPAALRLLARAARGSMRDALSLTDQAIAHAAGAVEEAAVRAMLGSVDGSHAAALVEHLARRDGSALLARLDELRAAGQSADGTLETMAVLLQQMAVEQAVPGALDRLDPDLAEAIRLAPVLRRDETQLLYSIVLHGRDELALMSDEHAALTMVLLRLLAFAPADAAGSAPSPAEPAAAATPAPAKGAKPAADARAVPVRAADDRAASVRATGAEEPPPWLDAPPPADDGPAPPQRAALRASAAPSLAVPAPLRGALGDRWAEWATRLEASGAIAALVRELAWQAELVEVDDTTHPPTWHLRVERDSLRTDALRDKLAQALQTAMGEPLQLALRPGAAADSPARRDAAERERRQAQAEAAIRNDPLVQDLMAQFKTARIVPGSIKPL